VRGADFASIHLHKLRHTFATTAFARVLDPYAVSSLLGHSDSKATEAVHAHFLPDRLDAVRAKLDDGVAIAMPDQSESKVKQCRRR
jgi:integrase